MPTAKGPSGACDTNPAYIRPTEESEMPRKPSIPRTCEQCSRSFLARTPGARYCSRSCQKDAKRHVCEQCGGVFIAYRAAHRRFCSPDCANRAGRDRRGVGTGGWRGGPVARICEACGASFTVEQSRLLRRNGGRFCSHSCLSASRRAITGEAHHLWKGGKEKRKQRERDRAEYKEWRTAVFVRDRYTCQMCGAQGRVLNAHHIMRWRDYPDLRFAVDNGVTLCVTCHRAVNHSGASLSYTQRELF